LELSTPTYNTTGFVAVDDMRRLIVVSFRGTDALRSFQTFVNNFIARDNQDPVPFCPGCAGARGYFGAYLEVNARVIDAVKGQLNTTARGDYQVVTIGHSQGGAISTFAALELRNLSIPVHAVSTLVSPSGKSRISFD
jgi:alpha-beta hydrolase superfamily lysophospholipase